MDRIAACDYFLTVDPKTNNVTLIHESAKDFSLTEVHKEHNMFHVDASEADMDLAIFCLNYILKALKEGPLMFTEDQESRQTRNDRLRRFPLRNMLF